MVTENMVALNTDGEAYSGPSFTTVSFILRTLLQSHHDANTNPYVFSQEEENVPLYKIFTAFYSL